MTTKSDQAYQKEYRRYAFGLLGALVLTYSIYLLATMRALEGMLLAGIMLVIAVGQLLMQLVVFLHVRDEMKPRWTLWSIIYSVAMMLIVVIGSLWVMFNLNYNMHVSPEQMDEFMLEQNKKGF